MTALAENYITTLNPQRAPSQGTCWNRSVLFLSYPLSLRKIIHLAASHLGVGHVSGARKFLGQRTGTHGAGEGRDVVLGSVPAPGSSPRGAQRPQAAAAPAYGALLLCGAVTRTRAASARAPYQVYIIEEKNACSPLYFWKIQSSRERRNRPPFTPTTASVDVPGHPVPLAFPAARCSTR